MGWNYWFNWAVTVAADLVASGLVMAYWFPSVPSWLWAVGFLVIVVGLNALSARVYGEAEFWLAAIKVVIVVVFVISGVFMIAGVMGMNSPGLSNWSIGDAPFHNGFVGVIAVFMIAGFSFQGTEMIGVAAGESENPPPRRAPRTDQRVLAHHALLHRRDGRHRLPDSLLRPEPAHRSGRQHQHLPVHPHLRACGHRLRGSYHERRDPLRSALCR